MAFLSIRPSAVRDFRLDDQDSTVFHLGLLDVSVRVYVSQFAPSKDDPDQNYFYAYTEAIRFGLRGWTGMLDGPAGVDVSFRTQSVYIPKLGRREVVAEDLMNSLPLEWVSKLGQEIIAMNYLDEQDQKNS